MELTPNDKLKSLIDSIGNLTILISNVSDGFSFQEIGEVIALVRGVKAVLADVPGLTEQYKNLDEESRQQLYGYIEQSVKFPKNVKVEQVIDKALEVAVSLSTLFTLLKPF